MKTITLINKLETIKTNLNTKDISETLNALNALILDLKTDFQKENIIIPNADKSFYKMVKRIYKQNIKTSKNILAYAALIKDINDYDSYTVLTDSFSLIAKKSDRKIDNVLYFDDNTNEKYPKMDIIIKNCLMNNEHVEFDRIGLINQLKKITALKENKNKMVYFTYNNLVYTFDPKRLLEMLSIIDTNYILLSNHSQYKPILLKNNDYIGIVSPVRCTDNCDNIKINLKA